MGNGGALVDQIPVVHFFDMHVGKDRSLKEPLFDLYCRMLAPPAPARQKKDYAFLSNGERTLLFIGGPLTESQEGHTQ